MRAPAHLERLLRAVRRELSVPLTLKIRTGWDAESINCVEIARLAEDAGVAMVTVHGRTRQQAYQGLADWQQIGLVKQAVSIPVVGSGDVASAGSARERMMRSGVDGLAIGRGALADPWIFSRVARGLGGGRVGDGVSGAAPSSRREVLERYAELLAAQHPERTVAARLRMFATSLLRGFAGAAALRQRIAVTRGSGELLGVLRGAPLAAVHADLAA